MGNGYNKLSLLVLLALLFFQFPLEANSGGVTAPASVPHSDKSIAMRGFVEMPLPAFEYLADVVEPTKYTVGSKLTASQIIAKRCGDGTPSAASAMLRRKVRELNPGKIDDSKGRLIEPGTELLLPYCNPIHVNTQVEYFQNKAGLDGLVRTFYPVAGPVTQRHVLRNSSVCKGRSLKACSRQLNDGDTLTLPYSSDWNIAHLKPGHTPTAVVSTLEEFSPDYATYIRENIRQPDQQPISFVHQQIDQTTTCGTETPAELRWPFDPKLVWDQFSRMVQIYRDNNRDAPIPQAHVALLDSGIARAQFGKQFPVKLFYLNEKEKVENGRDDDDNGIADDRHGIGAALAPEGNIFAFVEDKFFNHGTQVASVALGGPSIMEAAKSMSVPPIVVSILRASRRHQPGSITPEVTFIPLALQWAQKQNVAILNVSLKHHLPLDSDYSQVYANTLIVAAAGNDSNDLEDLKFPSYPAYAGGNSSVPVITVGGHDRHGKRMSASNFSENKVDLLAPGCSITGIDSNGKSVAVNGTSFAAPLVTFTAGLLRASGMVGPREIRNRVLAGTDFEPALAEEVWSGGVLNIAKTISIYSDTVVVGSPAGTGSSDRTNNELLFGTVVHSNRSLTEELSKFCSPASKRRKMTHSKIAKFTPYFDKQHNLRVRYLIDKYNNPEQQLRQIECALNQKEKGITIQITRDNGDQEVREVDISDIVDVVPRVE